MKRREFIELSANSLGGLLIYSLAGEPIVVSAQEGKVKVPLRFFTAREAKVIVAACERIFPADESGPGATQAGAMVYIDRQLAGPYGTDKYRYTKPPFVKSLPGARLPGQGQSARDLSCGYPQTGRGLRGAGWGEAGRAARGHRERRTFSNCCGSTRSRGCSVTRCMAAMRASLAGRCSATPVRR